MPAAEFSKANYYGLVDNLNENSTEFTEHLVVPKYFKTSLSFLYPI